MITPLVLLNGHLAFRTRSSVCLHPKFLCDGRKILVLHVSFDFVDMTCYFSFPTIKFLTLERPVCKGFSAVETKAMRLLRLPFVIEVLRVVNTLIRQEVMVIFRATSGACPSNSMENFNFIQTSIFCIFRETKLDNTLTIWVRTISKCVVRNHEIPIRRSNNSVVLLSIRRKSFYFDRGQGCLAFVMRTFHSEAERPRFCDDRNIVANA